MYEALILDLRERLENFPTDGFSLDYCRIRGACEAMKAMNEKLSALQAENGELRAALSRVEAERGAAMAEIPHKCRTCKHKPQKYGICEMGCEVGPLEINHAELCKWEWHGAQGEG